jgi:hypothetical protein
MGTMRTPIFRIPAEEDRMGAVRGLVKSAVVLKLVDVVRREAAKPENQARARELAHKVAQEVDRRRRARAASRSGR